MEPTLVTADMRYWRMKPDARLRPWVQCYFIVEPGPAGGRVDPQSGQDDLMLPDGHSEIVFNFGGAYERWQVSERERATTMRSSYLIGGRSHSVLTHNLTPLRLAGVKLDSRALHALIDVPLDEFADATLSLANLNACPLIELEDALATARDAATVHRMLNRFFLRALGPMRRAQAAHDRLLHDLHRTRGALPILQWARDHQLDPRTLERRFGAAFGMTPKRYARVIRFKHSYHHLIEAPGAGATGAHLDGFYDQSHFHREFRFFTGTAPQAKLKGSIALDTRVSDHLLQGELKG